MTLPPFRGRTFVLMLPLLVALAPSALAQDPAALVSFQLSKSKVYGGDSQSGFVEGTVEVSASADAAIDVTLGSDVDAIVFQTFVQIPAGQTTERFEIRVGPVAERVQAHLTATVGTSSQSATLWIEVLQPPALQAFSVPTSVAAGEEVEAEVVVAGPAPMDFQIFLTASPPNAVLLPESVRLAAGATTARFPVSIAPGANPGPVVLTARLGPSATMTTTLTVGPAGFQPRGVQVGALKFTQATTETQRVAFQPLGVGIRAFTFTQAPIGTARSQTTQFTPKAISLRAAFKFTQAPVRP